MTHAWHRLTRSRSWRRIRRVLSDLGLVKGPIGWDPVADKLFYVPHSIYYPVEAYCRHTTVFRQVDQAHANQTD